MDLDVFTDIQLLTLELEYNLTVRVLIAADDCSCPSYLIGRKSVLIPEVLKLAHKENIDPVDVFARYAKRVHETHE